MGNSSIALSAHLVGSIPLPDNETVFRKLAAALGPHLRRMPDGETGIRQSWIRFLQAALAEHPAIEVASGVAPFRFEQFDGKLVREIELKRVVDGADIDPDEFRSGYADMAIESWQVFESLQRDGVFAPDIKFQICMPTPVAPTYNNMVPEDRAPVLRALSQHFIGEIRTIAATLPNDRLALQWDVCQEVLAWEGYYPPGPVDFRVETVEVLTEMGQAVPAEMELGYHLCYGSPLDEHIVQPRDTRIMVAIANAVAAGVERPIQFVHMPVPKARTDDAYFAPLAELELANDTELYLGLIHFDDAQGDMVRLDAARKVAEVAGIATECGMGRGDPARLDGLLAAHAALINAAQ
jgi:hypothetical protein